MVPGGADFSAPAVFQIQRAFACGSLPEMFDAGLKAEFHHCYGALLVEVAEVADAQDACVEGGVVHDLLGTVRPEQIAQQRSRGHRERIDDGDLARTSQLHAAQARAVAEHAIALRVEREEVDIRDRAQKAGRRFGGIEIECLVRHRFLKGPQTNVADE